MALVALFFSVSPLGSHQAEAATLYLRSSNSKVTVGSLVTVNLLVDTQGKIINNAESSIQFSNDLVEVVSLNYRSSIFSLWVETPNFSNNSGRISFNGGIPDPGYKGSGANVLSVIVKAKKAGTASFVLSGAAVRENDGLGTDILTGQSSASFVIAANDAEPVKPPVVTPEPTKPESNDSASGPALTLNSSVFGNSNTWYAKKSGTISWRLPSNASAVQTLLDNNANSTPRIEYVPAIASKNIGELSDGVWYFHVRYRANNVWSKTATYKIQVDTTGPSELKFQPEKSDNCVMGVKLSANDVLSGLDYYNIKIDDEAIIKVLPENAANLIPFPELKSGKHHILIEAYDKAGNKSTTESDINTDKLEVPVISSVNDRVVLGAKIEMTGETKYPNSALKIAITSPSGTESIFDAVTDNDGKFLFLSNPMSEAGVQQLSVYVVGCNGEANSEAAVSRIEVTEGMALTTTGQTPGVDKPVIGSPTESQKLPINWYLIITLLELILILVLLYIWYKNRKLKDQLESINRRNSNLTMGLLLEKANKDLAVLEKAKKKKKLNLVEARALDSLTEIIDNIESIRKHK